MRWNHAMHWSVPFAVALATASAAHAEAPEVELARKAYHFAFPVYEVARTRWQFVGDGEGGGLTQPNALFHGRNLADASTRFVTTPNNDTLYSNAFLDLSAGPVLLTIPPQGGRYLTYALLDLFTDNFAVLDDGGGAGARYLIAGPGWSGEAPEGATLVRAPTNDVWMIGRVLVDGPADLEAARKAQAAVTLSTQLQTRAAAPLGAPVALDPDPEQFLAVVNERLGRGPLPPAVQARLAPFAKLGIRPGDTRAWRGLPPRTQTLWREHLAGFRAELKASLTRVGRSEAGWSYPDAAIGDFGENDRYRAAVALWGLGALPVEEAVYVSAAADAEGAPLKGERRYRLRLPPGGVPVDSFWSLSMYRLSPEGRLYFVDNPIDRYAIGNRTPGLKRGPDGSIEILIQHEQPADTSNWLPAPAGPFRPILRAYLPKPELASGKFRLPPIELIP